jgi:hypothetical protein
MKVEFTWWQEPSGFLLGYLNEFPDYWTQGESLDDLKEHLLDLHREFSKGDLPGLRRVG